MLKPKTSVQNQRALHYKRFTQIEKSDSLSTLYKTIADDKFWKFDFENQKFIEVQDSTIKSNTKLILITDVSVIKHQDAYFKYINKSWEFVGGTTYYANYNDWTPGLYDEHNNLVKTWEQLVEEDYFYVQNVSSTLIQIKKGSNPDFNNLTGKIVFTHEATALEYDLFNNHEKPISIVLPDNIEQGARCFNNCSGLKELIIGKNFSFINVSFENCVNLEFMYINSKNIHGKFSNCGTNTNGISVVIGSNVKELLAMFGNEVDISIASNVKSLVFEENSQLTTVGYGLFYNCLNFKYAFLPDVEYHIYNWNFQSCFINCSLQLTLYCEFSEEKAKYFVSEQTFKENWNYINDTTQAKTIYGYKPIYTLDNFFNGTIAKYQINKYYYVDSFDFMKKGSTDRIETQPIRGLITPLESFQIRTFDDDIDLDHDDLVVIDGKLYAIESIEVVEKRVPKKFRIYFATVTSIL